MTSRTKQIALLSLAIALMALLLLSASFSDLQLKAGRPFPGAGDGARVVPDAATQTQLQPGSLALLEAIFAVLLLILMIYVPARLIGLVNIRSAVWLVAAFVVLLALLSIVPRVLPGRSASQSDGSSEVVTPPSFIYPVSPLGRPPAQFTWLAAAGLVLGASLVTIHMLERTSNRTQATAALVQEAEKALHELEAGKDFPNVIIRCYLQMTEVLRAEQRIERQQSMTVREFQDWLESKGVPPDPVHQLTSLFEKARYGRDQIDHSDEETGTDCLRQIIEYCRKGNVGN